MKKESFILLVINLQAEKGSPSYPWLQMQRGTWFLTLHWAFCPHKPGHGSLHFLEIQASSGLQSEFRTHSGLQLGGLPIISGTQVHWHLSPMTWGVFVLGPQGLGSQGSGASTGSIAKIQCLNVKVFKKPLLTDWSKTTWWEWVTFIAFFTCTCWYVINYSTLSINSTKTWTWINAVVIFACFIDRAVWMNTAFSCAC